MNSLVIEESSCCQSVWGNSTTQFYLQLEIYNCHEHATILKEKTVLTPQTVQLKLEKKNKPQLSGAVSSLGTSATHALGFTFVGPPGGGPWRRSV